MSISSPQAGATLTGTISVSGTASDADGFVTGLAVEVDGVLVGEATIDGGQWTCSLDSSWLGDGEHRIAATAVDEYGNAGTAAVMASFSNGVMGAAGQVKTASSGAPCAAAGLVVTATTGQVGCIYAESLDRSSGIRIDSPAYVEVGDVIRASGTAGVSPDGEAQLGGATVEIFSHISPLSPLGLNPRDVGGAAFGLQEGTALGIGLNNVGLLVRVWGRVTDVEQVTPPAVPSWFMVSDGSAAVRVLCPSGVPVPEMGRLVLVTGISSCYRADGNLDPLLRVRSLGDVAVLQ